MDDTQAPSAPQAAAEDAAVDLATLAQQIDRVDTSHPTEGEAPPASPPPAEEKAPSDPPPAKADGEVRKARRILAEAKRRETAAAEAADAKSAELTTLARENPVQFLEKTGLTVEQFLQKLSGIAPTPPTPEERIAALEAQIAADQASRSKEHEDQKRQAQESADAAEVEKLTAEIHAEITASPAFPLVNRGGAHSLVTQLMVDHYSERGKPLAWDEAAREVEGYLAKLGGGAAPTQPARSPAQVALSPRPAANTLTNTSTSGGPAGGDEDSTMTEEARFARVLREIEAVSPSRH